MSLAQFGSEVTTYITSKSKGKYICVWLNLAPKLQHTLQVKAKENTFCVRLNPAPKLQHTLQVKAKENTLQVKANENENTCLTLTL